MLHIIKKKLKRKMLPALKSPHLSQEHSLRNDHLENNAWIVPNLILCLLLECLHTDLKLEL